MAFKLKVCEEKNSVANTLTLPYLLQYFDRTNIHHENHGTLTAENISRVGDSSTFFSR